MGPQSHLLDQQDQKESQVVVNQEHNLVDSIGIFQGLVEDETETDDMTEEKDLGIVTVKRFDRVCGTSRCKCLT